MLTIGSPLWLGYNVAFNVLVLFLVLFVYTASEAGQL